MELLIYLLFMLDRVRAVLMASSALVGIVTALCFIVGLAEQYASEEVCQLSTETAKKLVRYGKRLIPLFLFFLILSVSIPTTKQATVIWLAPKVVRNEHIQNVPDKSLELLDKKLESWLKDMKEDQSK